MAGAWPPEISPVSLDISDPKVIEKIDHRLRTEPKLRNWPQRVVRVVHVRLGSAGQRALRRDHRGAPSEIRAIARRAPRAVADAVITSPAAVHDAQAEIDVILPEPLVEICRRRRGSIDGAGNAGVINNAPRTQRAGERIGTHILDEVENRVVIDRIVAASWRLPVARAIPQQRAVI